MTVLELLDALNALPDDCHPLPVLIEMDCGWAELAVILVDPPNNWHGLQPKVIFKDRSDYPRSAGPVVLVTPRHGGAI